MVATSTAGLLNEMDQVIHLDGHLQLKPQTIGVLGVQLRQTDYTANQVIGIDPVTGQNFMSE